MYDLVIAQKNDFIYDNGKNRTVAFSDKTEESAIEIQIFGNVFVRLLNMIFEKPFDGREVEQFLGRCCIFDINGIVSFKGTMLAEAAQNEIVQEVRNKIIRVAA